MITPESIKRGFDLLSIVTALIYIGAAVIIISNKRASEQLHKNKK